MREPCLVCFLISLLSLFAHATEVDVVHHKNEVYKDYDDEEANEAVTDPIPGLYRSEVGETE